jgi:predicted nucleic acid-binding Zn finger protein
MTLARTTPERQTFRATLAQAAEQARALLPTQVNGRIESAVKLVLHGDVEPQADGTMTVYSATDATRRYVLQGTSCTCSDYERRQAPEGWCAHKIAANLQRSVERVLARMPLEASRTAQETRSTAPASDGTAGVDRLPVEPEEEPEPTPPAPAPLPEAPVSITPKASLHGYEALVTLRGVDFASVKAQVEQAATWLKAQAPPQSPGDGWCSLHNMPLKATTKNGQTWRSHKTADGWCRGK